MNVSSKILSVISDGKDWTSIDIAERIGESRRLARGLVVRLREQGCVEASPVYYAINEAGLVFIKTKPRTGEARCVTRRVLKSLADGEGHSVLDIAAALKMKPLAVRNAVGSLRDRSLVDSTPVCYTITEKGLGRVKTQALAQLPQVGTRLVANAIAAQPLLMRLWG